jgi:hypothetical protein
MIQSTFALVALSCAVPLNEQCSMRCYASADFWSGLLFAACGSIFILIASQYEFGSAAAMGPGYFPVWLGGALVVFGAVLVIKSTAGGDTEAVSSFVLRPALIIIGSLALFALLLERAGLVLSSLTLLYVGSHAAGRFTARQLALFSVLLVTFASVLFGYVLGVPIRFWPAL